MKYAECPRNVWRNGGMWHRFKQERYYNNKRQWTYKEIGQFWDTVEDYDEIDDETYAYKRRFTDSLKLCSIPDNSQMLDIDCRTGNGTLFFHRNKKVSNSTCVTPSKKFAEVCASRLKKNKVNSKTLKLEKLPLNFKNNNFDAILCFETVEHLSEHKDFLDELYRVLKPGGEMILTMPNKLWNIIHSFAAIFNIHHSEGYHRFLSRRQIKELLWESDFDIIKEDTTVCIPIGNRVITYFGEIIEKITPKPIRHLLFLRHIFIVKKC